MATHPTTDLKTLCRASAHKEQTFLRSPSFGPMTSAEGVCSPLSDSRLHAHTHDSTPKEPLSDSPFSSSKAADMDDGKDSTCSNSETSAMVKSREYSDSDLDSSSRVFGGHISLSGGSTSTMLEDYELCLPLADPKSAIDSDAHLALRSAAKAQSAASGTRSRAELRLGRLKHASCSSHPPPTRYSPLGPSNSLSRDSDVDEDEEDEKAPMKREEGYHKKFERKKVGMPARDVITQGGAFSTGDLESLADTHDASFTKLRALAARPSVDESTDGGDSSEIGTPAPSIGPPSMGARSTALSLPPPVDVMPVVKPRASTESGASDSSGDGRTPQRAGGSATSPALSVPSTAPSVADWRSYLPLKSVLKDDNRGHKMYEKFKKIGSGVFARVYRTTRRGRGGMVAVKVFMRCNVQAEIAFSNEVKLLSTVSHPNLIHYFGSYVDKKYFYLEMELCLGGDLWTHMVNTDRVSEAEARVVCLQLLDVLNELSSRNFAHRDLKPENIVLLSPRSTRNIRIIDFGECIEVDAKHRYPDGVGTLVYFAPERWGRPGPSGAQLLKSDVWAVGLIVWELIAGQRYYSGLREAALRREIRNEPLVIPDYMQITAECNDFFSQLLCKDPSKRPSSQEAFRHPWLWRRPLRTTAFRQRSASLPDASVAAATVSVKSTLTPTDGGGCKAPMASAHSSDCAGTCKRVSFALRSVPEAVSAAAATEAHIRHGSIIIPPPEITETERHASDNSMSSFGVKKSESMESLPLSPAMSTSFARVSPEYESSGRSSPSKAKRAPSDSFSFAVESESKSHRYYSRSHEDYY